MQRTIITFLKSEISETSALETLYKNIGWNLKFAVQKHSAKYWVFSAEGHDAIFRVKRFKNRELIKKVLKNV